MPDVRRDDVGADVLEPVHARDEAPVARRASDAEERLDFVPGREDHERGEEREHEQRDPEADVRAPRGAAALDPGAAAGPLAPVGPLDRERVERRRVLGEAPAWLRAGSAMVGKV